MMPDSLAFIQQSIRSSFLSRRQQQGSMLGDLSGPDLAVNLLKLRLIERSRLPRSVEAGISQAQRQNRKSGRATIRMGAR